jgi:hypothetical protein
MRVAIVSDTLVQSGGAERVVEALAEAFPDAPVFAVLYSLEHGPKAIRSRVKQSWLSAIPGAIELSKLLLPLYPSAIEGFDLTGYDVIVSSHHSRVLLSHADARAVGTAERRSRSRAGLGATVSATSPRRIADVGFRGCGARRPFRHQ